MQPHPKPLESHPGRGRNVSDDFPEVEPRSRARARARGEKHNH